MTNKHPGTRSHYCLRLPTKHKRIKLFMLKHQKIARQFITAYMRPQLHKSILTTLKFIIYGLPFHFYLELMPSISSKSVNYNLSKTKMVAINIKECFQRILSQAMTIEPITGYIPLMTKKHVERNYPSHAPIWNI